MFLMSQSKWKFELVEEQDTKNGLQFDFDFVSRHYDFKIFSGISKHDKQSPRNKVSTEVIP